MARAADGSFQEITWDDAIARLAAKLGEAGSQVAVISGAGAGTFSDLLAEWTSALGGRVVRYEPFDQEPHRAANRQVFGAGPGPRLRLRARALHRVVRRGLPGDLGRLDREQPRIRQVARVRREGCRQVRLRRPADGPDRAERGSVARHQARHRGRAGAGDGERAGRRSGRPGQSDGGAGGLHARDGGAGDRRSGRDHRARRPGVRARRGPASPWPAGSASQHAGATELCAGGQSAQLRRRQRRRDGALRRRAGSRRRLRGARRPRQGDGGGRDRAGARARRQPGLHPAAVPRASSTRSGRSGTRSPPRSTWTRPRRYATSCCRSITPWSAGTTSGRARASTV